ncbi:hypothetical protein ILUMI_03076 [Ignelater luminosus]|uniref:Uncharacterized protein n=1 Tax=Ignelater luminosus TaxID=2038154 RepID=A0A8K0DMJ6_IGNLU|nr:hypothetical protein ILUMI_03076 [Ignelater luminosus]
MEKSNNAKRKVTKVFRRKRVVSAVFKSSEAVPEETPAKSRKIINSILQFMKREADAGAPMIPLSTVQQLVSAATGISLRTINRIAKEGREIEKGEKPSFSTPNKIRKNRKSKVARDDFDKAYQAKNPKSVRSDQVYA